jgi:hypothetical protein
MKKRRWVLVVAVLYTVVAGVLFCVNVAAIASAFAYRPTVEATGSGGIGAVSAGIAEVLLEGLPFLAAAIFVNLSIAGQAKQRGRGAVWIRRAHLVFTVLTVLWPFVFFPMLSMGPAVLENLFVIMAALGTAVFAAHCAFGVFAIKLLRTGSAAL